MINKFDVIFLILGIWPYYLFFRIRWLPELLAHALVLLHIGIVTYLLCRVCMTYTIPLVYVWIYLAPALICLVAAWSVGSGQVFSRG